MAYPSSWDFDTDFVISGGNVDPLGNHTPSISGVGFTDAAGNNDNLQIDDTNNTCYHAGAGALQWNGATADVSGGWNADHTAEGEWSQYGAGVATYVFPMVRLTLDGTNQVEGYGVYHNGSSNNWQAVRVDQAINATVLDTYFDNSPSVTDTMALEASGTSMIMYLNGTDVSSSPTADSTYTGGSAGIGGRKTGDATYALTNFRAAGEVAAGGANPKGPLGMPFHGPFAGPIGP